MRYLGLDLGSRTLGVSISDTTGTIASTLKTIRFDDSRYELLIPQIKDIVSEFRVGKIVLGLPKNMNSTIGERGEICLKFRDMLVSKLGIDVVMQDERLSTVEATNYMISADMSRKKRKLKVDSLAANIILQTYLDKEKGK